MVKTASDMLPLGTMAPDFTLIDAVSGRNVSMSERSPDVPVLVMFICNHCPYVVHLRHEFLKLAQDYDGKLTILAINSNSAATHPQDGPEHMKALAVELGWPFPFLFDATQEVAKAYRAACTPDFFLFAGSTRHGRPLAYRGQFDGSRPGNNVPVTGKDLREAIDHVLTNQDPTAEQRPSLGCNIKWAPGNEPDYFPNAAPTASS